MGVTNSDIAYFSHEISEVGGLDMFRTKRKTTQSPSKFFQSAA